MASPTPPVPPEPSVRISTVVFAVLLLPLILYAICCVIYTVYAHIREKKLKKKEAKHQAIVRNQYKLKEDPPPEYNYPPIITFDQLKELQKHDLEPTGDELLEMLYSGMLRVTGDSNIAALYANQRLQDITDEFSKLDKKKATPLADEKRFRTIKKPKEYDDEKTEYLVDKAALAKRAAKRVKMLKKLQAGEPLDKSENSLNKSENSAKEAAKEKSGNKKKKSGPSPSASKEKLKSAGKPQKVKKVASDEKLASEKIAEKSTASSQEKLGSVQQKLAEKSTASSQEKLASVQKKPDKKAKAPSKEKLDPVKPKPDKKVKAASKEKEKPAKEKEKPVKEKSPSDEKLKSAKEKDKSKKSPTTNKSTKKSTRNNSTTGSKSENAPSASDKSKSTR